MKRGYQDGGMAKPALPHSPYVQAFIKRQDAEMAAAAQRLEEVLSTSDQKSAELEAELQAVYESNRRADEALEYARSLGPYQPLSDTGDREFVEAMDAQLAAQYQHMEDVKAQQELAELQRLIQRNTYPEPDGPPVAVEPSVYESSTTTSDAIAGTQQSVTEIEDDLQGKAQSLNAMGLMIPEVQSDIEDIHRTAETLEEDARSLEQLTSETESLALAMDEYTKQSDAYQELLNEQTKFYNDLAQNYENTGYYTNSFASLEEDFQRELDSLSNEAAAASNPSAETVNTEEEQLALAESFGMDTAALVEAQRQKILREGVVEPAVPAEMRHLLFTLDLERVFVERTLEELASMAPRRPDTFGDADGTLDVSEDRFRIDGNAHGYGTAKDQLIGLHLARRERLNSIERPDFSILADVQAYSQAVREELMNIDDVVALSRRARQAMGTSIYEGLVSYDQVMAALELRKLLDRGVQRTITTTENTFVVKGEVVSGGGIAGGLEPVDPTSPLYQTEGNVISSNKRRGNIDFSSRSTGLGLGATRASSRFFDEEGIPFGHTNASAVEYIADEDDLAGYQPSDKEYTYGGEEIKINPDGLSPEEYAAVEEALAAHPLGAFSTIGLQQFLEYAQLAPFGSGANPQPSAAAEKRNMGYNKGGYASTGLMYYDNEADSLERYRQMSNAELDAELGRIRMESPANRGLLTNLIMRVLGERRAQERRDTVGPQESTGLMGYDEGGYARLPYVNLDAYADRVLENERQAAENAQLSATYDFYNRPFATGATPQQISTIGSFAADALPFVGAGKGFVDAGDVAANPNSTPAQVAAAVSLALAGLLPFGRPASLGAKEAADLARRRLDDVMDPTSDAGARQLEMMTNPTMAERIQNQQAADARGIGGDNAYLYPENYPGQLPSQSYGLRPSSRDTFRYSTNPSINVPEGDAPAPYFQGFVSSNKPSLDVPRVPNPPEIDTAYLLREMTRFGGTERGEIARRAYNDYMDQLDAVFDQNQAPVRALNEWLGEYLTASKTLDAENAEFGRLVQDAYDIELFGNPVTNRSLSNPPQTTVTLNQDGNPINVQTTPATTTTESPVLGGGLMDNLETPSSTPSISGLRGTLGSRSRVNAEINEAVQSLDSVSDDVVNAVQDTTNMLEEADGLLSQMSGGQSPARLGYGGFSINNLEDLTDQWSRANISEAEYRRGLQQMGVRIGGLKGNTDLDPNALVFELPDGSRVRGIDNI